MTRSSSPTSPRRRRALRTLSVRSDHRSGVILAPKPSPTVGGGPSPPLSDEESRRETISSSISCSTSSRVRPQTSRAGQRDTRPPPRRRRLRRAVRS